MSQAVTSVIAALGWVGAAATMGAYFLVASKRIAPDSLRYHALNISGAFLLAAACTVTGAWPSMVANAVFIGIGLHLVFTTKRAYLRAKLARAARRVTETGGGRRDWRRRRLTPDGFLFRLTASPRS